MKNKSLVTWAIILGVIVISVIILNKPKPGPNDELAKCLGEKSELYVQLGCHACETQENLFGTSYQYLNTIDCFYEREKCGAITNTPTWIIDDEKHIGVQSIETLKELTGC